jgi:hypothetical protein
MSVTISSPVSNSMIVLFPPPDNLTITVWNNSSSSLNLKACVDTNPESCDGPHAVAAGTSHDFTVSVSVDGIYSVYVKEGSTEHDRQTNIDITVPPVPASAAAQPQKVEETVP